MTKHRTASKQITSTPLPVGNNKSPTLFILIGNIIVIIDNIVKIIDDITKIILYLSLSLSFNFNVTITVYKVNEYNHITKPKNNNFNVYKYKLESTAILFLTKINEYISINPVIIVVIIIL